MKIRNHLLTIEMSDPVWITLTLMCVAAKVFGLIDWNWWAVTAIFWFPVGMAAIIIGIILLTENVKKLYKKIAR